MNPELSASFIIPALNEQENIRNTIEAIHSANKGSLDYEIIVCDNGSTDNTISVAEKLGAKTLSDTTATIGKLRNLGAQLAKGELLIFIDADVSIDPEWATALREAKNSWPTGNLIVTGSTCLVPNSASFVEQHWFRHLAKTDSNYINSGHLITTKEMFVKIEGFDPALRTAEDFDFCQRAKQAGGIVKKAPEIKAYHFGYPSTLKTFSLREAWHGRQDFNDLTSFISSKTAIAAIINASLLLMSVFSFFVSLGSGITVLALSFLFCFIIVRMKFGSLPLNELPATLVCCQFYLGGRALSPLYRKDRPDARA